MNAVDRLKERLNEIEETYIWLPVVDRGKGPQVLLFLSADSEEDLWEVLADFVFFGDNSIEHTEALKEEGYYKAVRFKLTPADCEENEPRIYTDERGCRKEDSQYEMRIV